MKGDFSRITFDPANHFSSVLLQQGRVTLDADPNEQASILLHYLRTLARDLIGPYGGPMDTLGFELQVAPNDAPATGSQLTIGPGRYYVDGILCESDGCKYSQQPDYMPANNDPLLAQLGAGSPSSTQIFWLYLDVWEQLITWIEDDAIREVALGGPDTCVRSRIVWQVKAKLVSDIVGELNKKKSAIQSLIGAKGDPAVQAALQSQLARINADLGVLADAPAQDSATCAAPLDALMALSDAQMAARLDPGQQIKDPCVISPTAAFRGAENQLYRVEIHQGTAPGVQPTFKWSRDNGSVATRWLGTEGNDLLVTSTRGFTAGGWVELSHDAVEQQMAPGVLVKLANVQNGRLTVDADSIPNNQSIAWTSQLLHPKVRRWDQSENDDITLVQGGVPIDASATQPNWIDLEDGIQVQFKSGGTYRSGDYWLIPARVATGTIDWPANKDGSLFWAPQGVKHHYAPLGFLSWNNEAFSVTDCRCRLLPTNICQRAQIVRNNDNREVVVAPAPAPIAVATPVESNPTIKRGRKPKPD